MRSRREQAPPSAAVFVEAVAGVGGAGDDEDVDTGAHVARWRRYGKDRLYVTASDGTKIGWRDLLTGEDHVEAPDLERAFLTALEAWSSGVGREGVPVATQPVIDHRGRDQQAVAEIQTDAQWEDLASHRAGAKAREQALALKQAAPVRTFLARALGVHTDERAWRVGADGEELVAAQLQRLVKKDPRWRFLHAIPVGTKGSDIDHVVVGPGGVFTLNAKHHRGGSVWVRRDTFMVNGQRFPYIRNSRHEASRASRLLTQACGFAVHARGVVVPVGADHLSVKDPPVDVAIVNRMALRDWLRRRPVILTDDQVACAFEAARRSTTWQ
jgi:hypothetical protein